MLRDRPDDGVIWEIHGYLSSKHGEIERKYDYRYSVLILVFSRLVSEGWLAMDELSGIGAEKLDMIRQLVSHR
jgi:hypothetical protein